MEAIKYPILLVLILFLVSCNQKRNVEFVEPVVEQPQSPFSEILEKEIKKMILLKNNKFSTRMKHISSVHFFPEQENNKEYIYSVAIAVGSVSVDTLTASGYTLFKDELVACYIHGNLDVSALLDKQLLLPFKDSISNYPDIYYENPDLMIDVGIRAFRFTGDSLIEYKESHLY